MSKNLAGKVAVVTGSGGGIGRSIALLMGEEGAQVVVNDLGTARNGAGISADPANAVVNEIKSKGGVAVANNDSVTEMEGGRRIIECAVDNFGRLDILVNCAGFLRDRMIFRMTEEDWDAVIAVHLKGHFTTIRHATEIFREQHYGRIVNFASRAGLGNAGQANYAAAKEGIIGLTRTVARDVGKYGVTCNAICPVAGTRMTITPELQASWEAAKARGAEVPRGMIEVTQVKPDDIAPFVCFLGTDEAANINGYVFGVRGGIVELYSIPTPIKTIYKAGRWTVDELRELVPNSIAAGMVNPAPPEPRS